MLSIQEIVDTLIAREIAQEAAEAGQFTLQRLIRTLQEAPLTAVVRVNSRGSPGQPHSYRGIYAHLALEISSKPQTVDDVLTSLENSLGRTFTGYKGGEFTMTADTPVWIANYGHTGNRIVNVTIDDDIVIFHTNQEDY